MTSLAPLLPKVDAILVLDGDGNRLAGKYYGNFLKTGTADKTAQDLRSVFESSVHSKMSGLRADMPEIITCQGRTVVFTGATDVRVVHVGPPGESELLLAHLNTGMYEAVQHLMGGSTDRAMVLDNLELIFLLIDEHCDGGIIMEVDGHKLASAVLLRDDEGAEEDPHSAMNGSNGHAPMPQQQGMPAGVNAADMTIGQALRQAREQFMAGMTSRDGM